MSKEKNVGKALIESELRRTGGDNTKDALSNRLKKIDVIQDSKAVQESKKYIEARIAPVSGVVEKAVLLEEFQFSVRNYDALESILEASRKEGSARSGELYKVIADIANSTSKDKEVLLGIAFTELEKKGQEHFVIDYANMELNPNNILANRSGRKDLEVAEGIVAAKARDKDKLEILAQNKDEVISAAAKHCLNVLRIKPDAELDFHKEVLLARFWSDKSNVPEKYQEKLESDVALVKGEIGSRVKSDLLAELWVEQNPNAVSQKQQGRDGTTAAIKEVDRVLSATYEAQKKKKKFLEIATKYNGKEEGLLTTAEEKRQWRAFNDTMAEFMEMDNFDISTDFQTNFQTKYDIRVFLNRIADSKDEIDLALIRKEVEESRLTSEQKDALKDIATSTKAKEIRSDQYKYSAAQQAFNKKVQDFKAIEQKPIDRRSNEISDKRKDIREKERKVIQDEAREKVDKSISTALSEGTSDLESDKRNRKEAYYKLKDAQRMNVFDLMKQSFSAGSKLGEVEAMTAGREEKDKSHPVIEFLSKYVLRPIHLSVNGLGALATTITKKVQDGAIRFSDVAAKPMAYFHQKRMDADGLFAKIGWGILEVVPGLIPVKAIGAAVAVAGTALHSTMCFVHKAALVGTTLLRALPTAIFYAGLALTTVATGGLILADKGVRDAWALNSSEKALIKDLYQNTFGAITTLVQGPLNVVKEIGTQVRDVANHTWIPGAHILGGAIQSFALFGAAVNLSIQKGFAEGEFMKGALVFGEGTKAAFATAKSVISLQKDTVLANLGPQEAAEEAQARIDSRHAVKQEKQRVEGKAETVLRGMAKEEGVQFRALVQGFELKEDSIGERRTSSRASFKDEGRGMQRF